MLWPLNRDEIHDQAQHDAIRMDAERAPGGASLEQADVVRGRLAAFEASLRALAAPAQ
jgi:hypothetical protein